MNIDLFSFSCYSDSKKDSLACNVHETRKRSQINGRCLLEVMLEQKHVVANNQARSYNSQSVVHKYAFEIMHCISVVLYPERICVNYSRSNQI